MDQTNQTTNETMNQTTFTNKAGFGLPLKTRQYDFFQYAHDAFGTMPERWAFLIGTAVADLIPAQTQDWKPVEKENIPEEGSTVVAYSAISGNCAFAKVQNGIIVAPLEDITHFLPLPAAPVSGQAQETADDMQQEGPAAYEQPEEVTQDNPMPDMPSAEEQAFATEEPTPDYVE